MEYVCDFAWQFAPHAFIFIYESTHACAQEK